MSKSRDLGEFPAAALDIDATGNVSVTGDVSLADNDKLILGTGSDLQIYHDGSNSYIKDAGTGDLILNVNNFRLKNAADSEIYLYAQDGGGVNLYHTGNAIKLTTTSTGINVTGTVTADGLTVETSTGLGVIEVGGPSGAYIDLKSPSSDDYDLRLITEGSGGELNFKDGSLRVRRAADVKLTVDSTGLTVADSLTALGNSIIGNGTISSVSGYTSLNIKSTSGGELQLGNTAGSAQATLWSDASGLTYNNHAATSHIWTTGSSEKMRIDSSGNVGIGTSSPSSKLTVYDTTSDEQIKLGYSSTYEWSLGRVAADGSLVIKGYNGASSTDVAHFSLNGNVGIGTSSPVEKLYVNSTSGDARIGLNAPTGSDTEIKFSNNGSVEYSIGHDDGTDNFVIGTANVDLPLLSVTKAGNVGIGTSSPRTTLDLGMPTLSSTLSRTLTDYQMMLEAPSGGGSRYAHNIGWSEITGSSVVVAAINAIDLGASSATGITFATGNSASIAERVRIDSNGSLLVGKAVADVSVPGSVLNANGTVLFTASGAKVVNVNRTGTDGTAVGFSNDGAQVGTISVSGSATAYNTSSDYRLKEDEVAMTGATERVKALRPVNFAWKADGSRVDGFFAHELAEVVPEAATGIKDAMMDEEYEVTPAVYEDVIIPAVEAVLDEDGVVITEAVEESTESVLVTEAVMGTRSVPDYQGIDQSKLVPLLTATIQELIARIEALEAGA